MDVVDHMLNQTTLYTIGDNVNPVTKVIEMAEEEVEDIKNFYFHNDTGKLTQK